MRLYWIRAQAPRRVLALAKHLGMAMEYVEMDLMAGELARPEYALLNPNKKVPTLVDGDRVLWESSAIMAYLCAKRGADMWPMTSVVEQIEVLRWLSWNDCHWAPAVSPFYFEYIVKSTFGMGPPDREPLRAKEANLMRFAAVLDQHLEGRDYVACDRLTIGDFQLASMATDWRSAEMPLESFPNVVRWIEGLGRIPAWADPWPSNGDDGARRAASHRAPQ
ncbi:glutathione S-transferase [Bradyrhizobium macuxiense]|uniref:Glutathione S-transferase n=1 Tax=Bradyrhizobium macuxiense TaxID=1755647 RepID=A0A560KPV1_9BRAD|nr:glutathione S-transferase family protein [Bradyrhizobium macuxiense]TWB85308.1 glutathione S-transferase [Bradyrhizobium macuxiense]